MPDDVGLATSDAKGNRDEMMPTKVRIRADVLNHPEDGNDAVRDMAGAYEMKPVFGLSGQEP